MTSELARMILISMLCLVLSSTPVPAQMTERQKPPRLHKKNPPEFEDFPVAEELQRWAAETCQR